jgi:hypothetical protein
VHELVRNASEQSAGYGAFSRRPAEDERRVELLGDGDDRIGWLTSHGMASELEILGLNGATGLHFEQMAKILNLFGGIRVALARVEDRHDVNVGFELTPHEHAQLESSP